MTATTEDILDILSAVKDPEIPVLTVADMGIIRDVIIHEDDTVEVVITPTYSGCPAMKAIEINIKTELLAKGFEKIKVTTVLSPAWTTDWMTETGKRKLKEYGIAPPQEEAGSTGLFAEDVKVPCPRCGSEDTKQVSRYGSTPCKAHYQCNSCKEPFDYFKCH